MSPVLQSSLFNVLIVEFMNCDWSIVCASIHNGKETKPFWVSKTEVVFTSFRPKSKERIRRDGGRVQFVIHSVQSWGWRLRWSAAMFREIFHFFAAHLNPQRCCQILSFKLTTSNSSSLARLRTTVHHPLIWLCTSLLTKKMMLLLRRRVWRSPLTKGQTICQQQVRHAIWWEPKLQVLPMLSNQRQSQDSSFRFGNRRIF